MVVVMSLAIDTTGTRTLFPTFEQFLGISSVYINARLMHVNQGPPTHYTKVN